MLVLIASCEQKPNETTDSTPSETTTENSTTTETTTSPETTTAVPVIPEPYKPTGLPSDISYGINNEHRYYCKNSSGVFRLLYEKFLCKGFAQGTANADDDERDADQGTSDQRIRRPKIEFFEGERQIQKKFNEYDR